MKATDAQALTVATAADELTAIYALITDEANKGNTLCSVSQMSKAAESKLVTDGFIVSRVTGTNRTSIDWQ